MAYTRGWNDGTPAGSRAANQIDDAIREFKVDLHERMDSTFAVDFLADPVVALPQISGKVTGRFITFGPHIFEAVNDEDDTRHDEARFELSGTGLTGVGMLPRLPNGITITKFEASMDRGAAANCTCTISRIAVATGVIGLIDTALKSAAGIGFQAGAGGVLAELTDSSLYWYGCKFVAAAFAGTGPRIYGIRLTVDIPDSRSLS